MKKIFVVLVSVMSLFCLEAEAQIINGPYQKKITSDRKAAPLAQVRESDVLWQKTIWRIIDLREKMNQPLYYPTRPMQGRMNLVSVLMKGIEDNVIGAYDASGGEDEFSIPMEFQQVKEAMGAATELITRTNFETGATEQVQVVADMKIQEVVQLMVKEVWYFDKQLSTLNVRIIGLCPIREYFREEDVNKEIPQRKAAFWVYYPESRDLLSSYEVFNPFNDGRNLSFDDLFINRKFDSYIIRESNIYNNRQISQYASGEYAAEESDRIHNDIFNFEQDLWEY